ncbi:prepilin [Xanthomonas campestris]|uniref:GspH/FimT family pseudopilin n=2 Tax=Xanthomonas campestris TaxID=339 RepID=UPI000E760B86|nr:GspH/FimT family pseudopilin [Xanthomonas campestris]RJU10813.1 prepilin [Xanthomonas campestris]
MTRLASRTLSVRHRAGFTLIEIMVTVAVLAIVLAVAVPAFGTLIRSSRLTSDANEFVAALQLARSEAVRQNSLVAVCRSDNGSTCAAGGAWTQFITVVVRSGQVLRVNRIRAGMIVDGSPSLNSLSDRVAFSPDGLARASNGSPLNGKLSVCLATASPAQNNRNVVISNGSRVSVERTVGATCSAPADS